MLVHFLAWVVVLLLDISGTRNRLISSRKPCLLVPETEMSFSSTNSGLKYKLEGLVILSHFDK